MACTRAGELISGLQVRKGVLEDMVEMSGHGRTRLVFQVPTRGLIGFRSLFTTMSHGEGIMNRAFKVRTLQHWAQVVR